MPPHQRRMARLGLPTAREIVRAIPYVLRESFGARLAVLGLSSMLVCLVFGQLVSPGYTEYWWYQFFQTIGTLIIVLIFNAAFASEGGMAIQTNLLVVGATFADIIGNAFNFYHSWEPYDKFVHFMSGAALAAGTFQALNFLSRRGMLDWGIAKRALAGFAASLIICGFAWETYEYMGDAVFNSGRVQSRGDTAGDLIADTLGALLAVAIIFQYERRHQRMLEANPQAHIPQSLSEGDLTPMPSGFRAPEREYAMSRTRSSMDD